MGGCHDGGAGDGRNDQSPSRNRSGSRPLGRRRDGRMDARLASSQRRDRSVRDHESSRDGRQQVTPGAPVLFVVNPASAAGKAGRQWAQVETWLPSAGIPYETAITTRPNEATDITQRAGRESRPVGGAVGGDGALNEVVNGFFHNGGRLPTAKKRSACPLATVGHCR